jgi:acetone carboxylase gamma subunit
MKIEGAIWSEIVNKLIIKCKCGYGFFHRADRWIVKCNNCKCVDNLARLRNEYRASKEKIT